MLLARREAQLKEECIDKDETLLARRGNEMLLVWIIAQQEKHVDEYNVLLARRKKRWEISLPKAFSSNV